MHGRCRILISRLGPLLNMPLMDDIDGGQSFDCERLQFHPGDILYISDSPSDRAYIVLSGLALRVREPHGGSAFGAPGQYAFFGRHELIGLHPPGKACTESAMAAFDTEVLALPLDAMRRVPGIAALLSEWVVRPRGTAVMLDWQMASRLRELPSYPRMVEGLAHLARLAMSKREHDRLEDLEHRRLDCRIDERVLGAWLDLPEQETGIELGKLERYHLISRKEEHIVAVDAHALAEFSAIILRHGADPTSMAKTPLATPGLPDHAQRGMTWTRY